jgi:hypothetical protein
MSTLVQITTVLMPHTLFAAAMLAIANRQRANVTKESGPTTYSYKDYDVPSRLYAWKGDGQRFYHMQDLHAEFRTVSEMKDNPGTEFCTTSGASVCTRGEDGQTWSIGALRGVTSITAFSTDGEDYLALAQSVCRRTASRDECQEIQPRSTILQYDRTRNAYGEFLSIKDADAVRLRGYEVPASEMAIKRAALRINSGRNVAWEYAEFGGMNLLLASTVSYGCVAFEFDFERVAGLAGAVHAVEDLSMPGRVYVLSKLDESLVTVESNHTYDSLGNRVGGGCGANPCLKYLSRTLSVKAIHTSRSTSTRTTGVQMLAGAYKLGWSALLPAGLRMSMGLPPSTPSLSQLIAFSTMPRSELTCGPFAPRAPLANGVIQGAVPAGCQRVSLELTPSRDTNMALFKAMPELAPDGTLTFESALLQAGTATFSIVLRDDLGGVSRQPSNLVIYIERVNHAPTFTVNNVDGGVGLGLQSLVFATNVVPGPPIEFDQKLSWLLFKYTEKDQFLNPPNVSLRASAAGDGTYEGIVSFEAVGGKALVANVTVLLLDDGPHETPRGDIGVSAEQTFSIIIQAVNSAPKFALSRPGFVVSEDSGPNVFPGFVANVTYGDDAQPQELNFTLVRVERLSSIFDPETLITNFSLSVDGTLIFETAPFYNGNFSVTVRLQDNGGTAFGGTDSFERSFYINVTAINSLPRFDSLGLVNIAEQRSIVTQVVPGAFYNISALPPDEVSQALSFVVISMSRTDLFASPPFVTYPAGDLHVQLLPDVSGVIELLVGLKGTQNVGPGVPLTLETIPVNNQPSFTLRTQVLYMSGVAHGYLLCVCGLLCGAFSTFSDEVSRVLCRFSCMH